MRYDHYINALAATQQSLAASWQLEALGLEWNERDRLLDLRRWEPVTTRVLARRGVPWTDRRRLMAAVLDASPGAVVAATSAAAMWGVPGYRWAPILLMRHRGISRRPSPLAVVREVTDLMPHHIKVVDGIPVTSPGRVVCDLAATQHPARVEHNLDWLIRQGLLDGGTFRRIVRDLARRGRTGSTLFRELDAARGPGYRPTDSGTEARFSQILERDGQKPFRQQVDTGDDEEWCGRVDFRDADLPLIVEVQSERYHTLLVDTVADALRRGRLEAAGFVVIEVWDTEIWHDARAVCDRIRAARRELRARLRPTG